MTTLGVLAWLIWAVAAVQPQGGADGPAGAEAGATAGTAHEVGPKMRPGREIMGAFYISQPFYDRSDVRLKRPNGTDLLLQDLGWDGDALKAPIDGGVRSVEWFGRFGFMVDFLHNKAIARLGKGAHGRKIANPVIETVDAEGTLKGEPAPARIKLTDLFTRLEFTHGHNVLIFTPLLRLGSDVMGVRPYVGAGAGVALPHVEVRFTGEDKDTRTGEYQYVGPAVQAVAGLEFRTGKFALFVEYKFSRAWVSALLTGGKSWKNFNLPGDLWNQFYAWWNATPPAEGTLETKLGAHQLAVGGGYYLQVRKPRPIAP